MKMRQRFGLGGAMIATFVLTSFALPARADEAELRATLRELAAKIEAMRAEQQRMQAKVDAVDKIAAAAPISAQAVTGGDIPGSFKLPGSNTSVLIGGYVKALASYSSRGPLGNPVGSDELLFPPIIPLSNVANTALRRNYWKESAKESRFKIETSTPSDYGRITTLVEVDFFGAAGTETATNSNGLRLRHAWGTVGNLGFGQFWTNVTNMTAVPETVDFTPQIGQVGGLRQGQIRWTQPTNFGFWSVAVENPESRIATTAGVVAGPDNDKVPDFNAKVHFKTGFGEYEAVGIAHKVNTTEAALAPAITGREVRSKNGFGVGVSGYIPIGDWDRIMFGVSSLKGMGRYLSGLFADAVLVTTGAGAATTGSLQGIDTSGGYLSYRHRWTPTLRSTWAYSQINAKYPAGLTAAGRDAMDKQFWTTHLNLIWTPLPSVDLGIEYLHANRKVDSGLSGELDRVQVAAKYKF